MTITVKDAVKRTARMLGIAEGVEQFLEGVASEVGERDTKLLLTCFQGVENELALDYLPLMAEEEILTATGLIRYAELEKTPVRILCVEDEWGKSVKYQLFPDYVKTGSGKVKLYYAYAPTQKSLEDNSEYQTEASERLFAYGMATEYCLAVGELAAAEVWDKKYKEAVRSAYRLRPCKRLRSRRWV